MTAETDAQIIGRAAYLLREARARGFGVSLSHLEVRALADALDVATEDRRDAAEERVVEGNAS